MGTVTIPCFKNGMLENNRILSKIRARTRLQNNGPVILGKRSNIVLLSLYLLDACRPAFERLFATVI